MYRCGFCGRTSKPGERASRVITEIREKIYPYRKGVNTLKIEGKKEVRDDPGGRGTEIVHEVLAHPGCVTYSV